MSVKDHWKCTRCKWIGQNVITTTRLGLVNEYNYDAGRGIISNHQCPQCSADALRHQQDEGRSGIGGW